MGFLAARRFGAIILVGLAVVGGPVIAEAQDLTREQVRGALMKETDSQVFATMRKYDPKKFEALVDTVTNQWNKTKDINDIAKVSEAFTANLRRSMASGASTAPDEALKKVLRLMLREVKKLRSDRTECGAYLIAGPTKLSAKTRQAMMPALDAQGGALLRALYLGKRNGGDAKVADGLDWGTIVAAMRDEGVTEEDLKAIVASDPKNKNYCKAMIQMLQTILEIDTAAGERVRATTVMGIAQQ